MQQEAYCGQNFSYIIDACHRFVTISDGMRQIYPHLRVGQVCYQSLYGRECPCDICPLKEHLSKEMTVFNPVLDKWVNVICTDVDLPSSPKSKLIACSVIPSAGESIMQRIPYMAGYDVFFEMNLTRNTFRRFFHGNEAASLPYEDEPLDILMQRTEETLVHPLDRDRFHEFWDLKTLMQRVLDGGGTLHDEFVEKSSRGGWDLIHTTIVPDVSMNAAEDIVVAMYTIIRSPQLAQIALEATDVENNINRRRIRETPFSKLVQPEDFHRLLAERVRGGKPGTQAVVHFDVENFRFFNRWVGREAGDSLIEAFSRELLSIDLSHNILPCRLNSENFACCIPIDYDLADRMAENLRSTLKDACGDMDFRLRIGACPITSSDMHTADLLDNARIAARNSLRGTQVGMTWHDEEVARETEDRMHSFTEVHTALVENQFEPFFQPKCLVETGQLIGVEALARWIHPERGIVGPGSFIPLMEESGEVARLDRQIWEKTFALVRQWLDAGIQVPPVSLNVSRFDITVMDVAEEMQVLSSRYGVAPSYIEVELTESALAEDATGIFETINRLRESGFAVLIDDFGSGYSSLNLLKDIPADTLKMDLKFLDFTTGNTSKGVAIIHGILDLSHTLGIPVVVEGGGNPSAGGNAARA